MLYSVVLIHTHTHTYSKEFRFLIGQTLTVGDVATEIRRQTGIRDDTPINVKWLDVEGEYESSVFITVMGNPLQFLFSHKGKPVLH